MRFTLSLILISTVTLSSCVEVRESRFNPFNWFGRSQEVSVEPAEAVNPLIPSSSGLFGNSRRERSERDFTTPISQITDLRVERVPGGAIVRATGLDATQGAFNVELVPETEDEMPVDGVLTYTFERQVPQAPQQIGPEATREVIVARRLTDQQLNNVRTIRIVAQSNARQVRR